MPTSSSTCLCITPRRETPRSAFIDELLPDVIDTFPLAKVRDEIKDAVHDMNQFMKAYYEKLEELETTL